MKLDRRLAVICMVVVLAALLAAPALAGPGGPEPAGAVVNEKQSGPAPSVAAAPGVAAAPTPLPVPQAELLTPADTAVTTGLTDPPSGSPAFKWRPVAGATIYNIQVSPSAGFSPLTINQNTYATAYTHPEVLTDGVWYWRVRAGRSSINWGPYSEVRSFQKDWSNGNTVKPQLLTPEDGAARSAFAAPDFTWTPVDGAASYLFQISIDPTFASVPYEKTTLAPHHTPAVRLAKNVYYWRVTPIDRRGNFGLPSQSFTFNFDWDLAPQLLGPADAADMAFLPAFSWTAVEGASKYRLELSPDPFFATVTPFETRNTDYTPVKALGNDQDYYWRVQAVDADGYLGPYSASRHFRIRWDFAPQLLTPANNSIRVSNPFFSWAPVPGAQSYLIQIDLSNAFSAPFANVKVFNATTYEHGNWTTLKIDQDYYWRVRAVDAQNNYGPWSAVRSFRTYWSHASDLVYPLYYTAPDAANLPVHGDRTIAWPVFVWDTAHVYTPTTSTNPIFSGPPDYYELTADDDPGFATPNFQIQTSTLAAAPTLANPFNGLQNGQIYYWRVRAIKGGTEVGYAAVWPMRYDATIAQLPINSTISPMYPADGFEAVLTAPVLGWLPVAGAGHYRVQISRNDTFTQIVDEAQPQFVNYVPWQGRTSVMPFGTYYWRVRAEAPDGPWSTPRHFNLSVDMVTGNMYDLNPASNILAMPITHITGTQVSGAGPNNLGELHMMLDRTYTPDYNWVVAFSSSATAADSLKYGIYFDTDHVLGSGAPSDPLNKPVSTDPLYRPEYVLYINRTTGNGMDPGQAQFFHWNGTAWDPPQSLASIGGKITYDDGLQGVQVLVPYTALGSANPTSVGSVALTVFSTGNENTSGMLDSLPRQAVSIARPAFVTDMLMPLYPFDTPLSNPVVYYDMPPMRWAAPYFDSVDGYQAELARDSHFTDSVFTTPWESYEGQMNPYSALLPTTFQPVSALEDNNSYYWHVRIRHERYTASSATYDYGPWSPPMRFKLDSRQPGNLALSTGNTAWRTPTFSWDRVEGAAGYTIQIDDDANFSSPLVSQATDGTSFTPEETSGSQGLKSGMYYWRVAARRSSTVTGHWAPTQSFVKNAPSPVSLSPINDSQVSEQPTFRWTPVLTPTVLPRLATPRYQLQVDNDANFGSPKTYTTDAASYTLKKGESLGDGTWYWRVAILGGNDVAGSYGPVQRFYKQYVRPTLLSPGQGSTSGTLPTFKWQPLDGAAYYKIEIADNELFNRSTSATTDNASYTPTTNLKNGAYYWRVQMFDLDNNPGPFELGRVNIGYQVWTPFLQR